MLGAPLAALPQKLLAEVVGFLIETVIVVGVAWHFAAGHYEAKIVSERAAVAAAAAAEAASAAQVTNQRLVDQAKESHVAHEQANAARADADAAGRARDALRVQLDAFVHRHHAAGDPAATAGGAPADDPIGVLADVLQRADARAGLLAELADQRGIAGALCERDYDALAVTP